MDLSPITRGHLRGGFDAQFIREPNEVHDGVCAHFGHDACPVNLDGLFGGPERGHSPTLLFSGLSSRKLVKPLPSQRQSRGAQALRATPLLHCALYERWSQLCGLFARSDGWRYVTSSFGSPCWSLIRCRVGPRSDSASNRIGRQEHPGPARLRRQRTCFPGNRQGSLGHAAVRRDIQPESVFRVPGAEAEPRPRAQETSGRANAHCATAIESST